jgi:probable HAF family extracellular repeat protein
MRTTTRAFFWSNDGTRMHDLGTLGGTESYAFALNDLGQVVGTADTLGALKSHAFVWMNDGTPMKDLGTLGGTTSVAYDINVSGQVTGSASLAAKFVRHAFLWRNDGTKLPDLNKLIDPNDPLKPCHSCHRSFHQPHRRCSGGRNHSRTGLQDLYWCTGCLH